MAKPVRFSAIDKKVFETLSSENLAKTGKVPDILDISAACEEQRQKHNEIQAYSDFKTANGFSAGGKFQTFARIDHIILKELEATHAVSCGCGKILLGAEGHKMWILEWANRYGQEYNTKGTITK